MSDTAFIAVLAIDVHVPGARSLKDKRKPLASIKQRMKNAGLAVAETGGQDTHRHAEVTIAAVADSAGNAADRLGAAMRVLDERPDLEITVIQRTIRSLTDLD